MKCTLCGFDICEDSAAACGKCPLSKGCNAVRCPNCGYENPKMESRVFTWIKRRFVRSR